MKQEPKSLGVEVPAAPSPPGLKEGISAAGTVRRSKETRCLLEGLEKV